MCCCWWKIFCPGLLIEPRSRCFRCRCCFDLVAIMAVFPSVGACVHRSNRSRSRSSRSSIFRHKIMCKSVLLRFLRETMCAHEPCKTDPTQQTSSRSCRSFYVCPVDPGTSYTVVLRASLIYILNENTHASIRAIGVSHTVCEDEFRPNLRSSAAAGVYFYFYDMYQVSGVHVPERARSICRGSFLMSKWRGGGCTHFII